MVISSRGITQDDAHIFCTEEQIYNVCNETTLLIERVYKDLVLKKLNTTFQQT